MMISIFIGILLTYINVLNILLFVLKCFTYVYTRYVLSELYTVLIIPSDQNDFENQLAQTLNENASRGDGFSISSEDNLSLIYNE